LKTPALDRLIFEDLNNAERRHVGSIVGEYLDGVGPENQTLDIACWHEKAEHDRLFAEVLWLEKELPRHARRGRQVPGSSVEQKNTAQSGGTVGRKRYRGTSFKWGTNSSNGLQAPQTPRQWCEHLRASWRREKV